MYGIIGAAFMIPMKPEMMDGLCILLIISICLLALCIAAQLFMDFWCYQHQTLAGGSLERDSVSVRAGAHKPKLESTTTALTPASPHLYDGFTGPAPDLRFYNGYAFPGARAYGGVQDLSFYHVVYSSVPVHSLRLYNVYVPNRELYHGYDIPRTGMSLGRHWHSTGFQIPVPYSKVPQHSAGPCCLCWIKACGLLDIPLAGCIVKKNCITPMSPIPACSMGVSAGQPTTQPGTASVSSLGSGSGYGVSSKMNSDLILEVEDACSSAEP